MHFLIASPKGELLIQSLKIWPLDGADESTGDSSWGFNLIILCLVESRYKANPWTDSGLEYVILIRIGARCRNENQNDLNLQKKNPIFFFFNLRLLGNAGSWFLKKRGRFKLKVFFFNSNWIFIQNSTFLKNKTF